MNRARDWWWIAGMLGSLVAVGVGAAFLLREEWLAVVGVVAIVAWGARDMWQSIADMRESLSATDYDRLLAKHGLTGGPQLPGADINSPEFADLLTLQAKGSSFAGDARAESSDSLLRRQAVRVFMERTDHLAEARAEAERWVGPTPRSAKRLANRLMFTVAVAASGGLLTTDSGVRGVHLGKWVALAEGWPRLAALIQREPALLEQLEGVAPHDEAFAAVVRERIPNVRDVNRLREMLGSGDPALSDVVASLTHSRSAPVGGRPAAGAW